MVISRYSATRPCSLTGGRREEQGVGCHRHRRVHREVGHHRPGERRQPGLVRAVGRRGAVHHRVHPRPHLGGRRVTGALVAVGAHRGVPRWRGRRWAVLPVAADSGLMGRSPSREPERPPVRAVGVGHPGCSRRGDPRRSEPTGPQPGVHSPRGPDTLSIVPIGPAGIVRPTGVPGCRRGEARLSAMDSLIATPIRRRYTGRAGGPRPRSSPQPEPEPRGPSSSSAATPSGSIWG